MVREACLGADGCFTLGHAVFEVLSSNPVEIPEGFMKRSVGCSPVRMEGEGHGRRPPAKCAVAGASEAWGAIRVSEPRRSANAGGKRKNKNKKTRTEEAFRHLAKHQCGQHICTRETSTAADTCCSCSDKIKTKPEAPAPGEPLPLPGHSGLTQALFFFFPAVIMTL